LKKILFLILILIAPTVRSQKKLKSLDRLINEISEDAKRQIRLCELEKFLPLSEEGHIESCELFIESEGEIYIKTHKVESWKSPVLYREIYYTKGDTLIFAKESEFYISSIENDTISWSCEYFFHKGVLIGHIIQGQRKEVNNNWNPKLIINKYNRLLPSISKN